MLSPRQRLILPERINRKQKGCPDYYDEISKKEPELLKIVGSGWDGIDTNTLIVDLPEGSKERGYISINKDEVQNAYNCFQRLKTYAKDLKKINANYKVIVVYGFRDMKKQERYFNEILEDVFKEAEYIKLKKSYRTSIEIMNEANKISKEIGLDEALPVIRSAGPVIKSKVTKLDKENYIVNQVKKYKEAGFKSIAIIYKNQKELVNMNKKLKENSIESEIIYKDQEKYDGGICLLTSYLSKGLEFDVVIIADAQDEIYKYDNRLDMKLLYVSMTRALHKLELVYDTNICRYLK